MSTKSKGFSAAVYALMAMTLLFTMLLCIGVGSVSIPPAKAVAALWNALWNLPMPEGVSANIIRNVRLPRVLNVALVGSALSLCGAAMQGLLRNPLADGSTLGVSSGASLGAVLALALGVPISPVLPAIGCAFVSLLLILSLAYGLDRSLSTNSIILIGVIFSMFASSIITLLVAFAGERLRSITFWTMGSLAGTGFAHTRWLFAALLVCGGVMLRFARELNAFAIGEENARHIGVNVKGVKLSLLISISVLIGICVSVSGTIGFVGLVMPHIARMVVGANHQRLLPASLFGGAVFLLLADLVARTLLSPIELPIGAVTSLVGAVVFVILFYRTRKGR